jgi:hypothetical protein
MAMASLVLGLLLLALPGTSHAAAPPDHDAYEESDRNWFERVWYPTADLLVVRPLGLAQLAVGTAMLPLAYPWDLISQTNAEVVDFCVKDPAEHVFTRPLGEF